MARKNDSVELVITAKNDADKTFDELIKSTEDLNAALTKKPAAGGLFGGIEKQLEKLVDRKKQADKLLGDVATVQKATAKQLAYAESVEKQSFAISKNQKLLEELKHEYAEVAKAAESARKPNAALVKSLGDLETRQSSLGDKLAITRQELEKSNAALTQNVGLDERAVAAISKQESKLLEVGKVWRQLTNDVRNANKVLSEISSRRDTIATSQADGKARIDLLKSEVDLARKLNIEAQKTARLKTATDSDRSNATATKDRLQDLLAVYNQSRQAQANLAREVTRLNAAYGRQEVVVSKLRERAATQKKAYDDLRSSVAAFAAAQKQEGSERQLANINKISASLNSLEQQYADTASKITAASAAINIASGVDPRAIARRDAYQKKIVEATLAVEKEQRELAELKTQLDATGLSTAALTNRQKDLDRVTEGLVAEQQRLTVQMDKLDSASKRVKTNVGGIGKTFLGMGNDTRTTLGYLQRIRGELLSIVATTTGLYAVGGAIKSIYDTSVLFSKAESRFGVFFKGDAEAVQQEVEFVKGLANDLKINFEVALDEYSKFVSGLDPKQIPLEEIRGTFQGFAVAARVGRLSAEDFGGVMRAVTQIFSKQKIQLEELQGQIGDRLPGALNRTAAALRMNVTELRALIENGQLGAQAAVLLANELQKEYGANLTKALEGPDAAMADFQNTVTDLKKEIADSGFIEKLTEVVRELTIELRNPATKQGIVTLVNGIGEIGKVIVVVLQNMDTFATALGVIFGAKIIRSIIAWGVAARVALIDFQKYMLAFAATGSTAAGVIAKLTVLVRQFLGVLGAGAAGYAFGTWLNQFALVRKAGYTFIAMIDLMIRAVYALAKTLSNPLNAVSAVKEFSDAAKLIAEDVAHTYDVINKGLDLDKPKKDAAELTRLMDDIVRTGRNVSSVAQGFLSEQQIQKLIDAATGGGKGDGKAAAKLKALEESILNSLNDIDQKIQEKSADTLEQRLDSIYKEYTKLLKKIEKATAQGSQLDFTKARESIDQIVAIKQLEAIEKEINSLTEQRKQSVKEINELNSTGAITIEEATKRINAENARILPQMDAALAKAREISNKIKSAPLTQSVDDLGRTVDLEKQRANLERLTILQTRLNEEMAVYRERVQTINSLVQSGTLSEVAAKEKIKELNTATNAQLSVTIQQMRELILANEQFAASFEGQKLLENLKQTEQELKNVEEKLIDITQVNQQFSSGLVDAFDQFISGAASAKDAFKSFVSDFLRQIAKAIAQQLIFNALQSSSGGGAGGFFGSLFNSASNHTGGIVGNTASRRQVPIGAFANAVKYHSGGIAGLRPNEVPSILKKGEEVLTRNDPRHILNGAQKEQQIKIVNAFDRDTVAKEAFSSPEATKAILNIVRANKNQFKTVLT